MKVYISKTNQMHERYNEGQWMSSMMGSSILTSSGLLQMQTHVSYIAKSQSKGKRGLHLSINYQLCLSRIYLETSFLLGTQEHQGREIFAIGALQMVHFALFLVKISINFSPIYSTVFFP
jgi:hypothetical protein